MQSFMDDEGDGEERKVEDVKQNVNRFTYPK